MLSKLRDELIALLFCDTRYSDKVQVIGAVHIIRVMNKMLDSKSVAYFIVPCDHLYSSVQEPAITVKLL